MTEMNKSKAIKLSTINTPSKKNEIYSSVVFFVTPEISEARSVSYAEISDVRLPASILIWMGTPSRNFSMNVKFIARSIPEADVAFRNLSVLKSWCVTHSPLSKGNSLLTQASPDTKVRTLDPDSPADAAAIAAQDGSVTNATGATPAGQEPPKPKTFQVTGNLFQDTPPVLLLEGYGGQFRSIPVIITNLNITFPSDTDYIKNSRGVMVPILHEISISLKEAREISGQRGAIGGFNLQKFREGTLDYW